MTTRLKGNMADIASIVDQLSKLTVLEAAELITNERRGKERVCRLRPETLARAKDWLDFSRRFWGASLDRLDQQLKDSRKERS